MTYFSVAITSGQQDKLRNTGGTVDRSYATKQLVFLCPNNAVFNARINGEISGEPTGVIAYDGVSFGATADIKIGQRIIISPTNNSRDLNAITCRVRDTPTGTTSGTIPINEISVDIADNSYIFVVDDYPLMDRLARPDPDNPNTTQFKDYSKTFQKLPPMIGGLQPSYVGKVSGGVARFAFNASTSYPTDDSATVTLTYQYTFVAGSYTVISGALNTSTVTVDINEGFQWGQLVVTDSNGIVTTFHFQIHAWGNTYTPVLGFDGATINGDIQTGYGVSVVAFTEVNDVLDNTWMTVVRNDEQYNGVAGQLISGDAYYVDFIGFLSQENSTGRGDALYGFVSDVTFEVTGIAQRLAQINMQAIGMRNNGTPTVWDQIDELMPWRAIVHIWAMHTTAATLIPLAFTSDVKNTSYFYPYFATPLGGNLLSSINYILNSINAALEFWPNGVVEGVRDIRYETELDRLGYLTLLDLIVRDFYDIAISRRHIAPVGKIYADGGFFNPNSGATIGLKSIAPGTAQQIGTDVPTLGQQVLVESGSEIEAQAELDGRAGNFNAIASDDGNTLTMTVPGGYAPIFYPSRNVLYTITYDDPTRGISYTTSTKWMCVGVTIQHSNERGSRTCAVTFIRLIPFAPPGDKINPIVPGEQTSAILDLAPLAFNSELPEFTFPLAGLDLAAINPLALAAPNGQIAKKDGSTWIIKSDDQAYLIQNAIIATTPQAYEVTPDDLTSTDEGIINITYLIGAVNGGSGPASVQVGEIFTVTNGTGGVGDQMGFFFDRCVKMEIISATNYSPYPVSGANFSYSYTDCDGVLTTYFTNVRSSWLTFWEPDICITQWNTVSDQFPWSAQFRITEICNNDFTIEQALFDPLNTGKTDGNNTLYLLENNSGDSKTRVQRTENIFLRPPTWLTGAQYDGLYSVIRGTNVSSGLLIYAPDIGGTAFARYSSTGGATFGSALTIGTSPGSVGGFDAQRSGANSFAAVSGGIERATTLGGAYSLYYTITGGAQAVCIIVPYFNWAGTKQTTSTNPDIIIALNQADGSGRTLLWIEGGATPGTVHDITPVAGITFESANCITTQYETHIAVIGLVSGNRRCYTTINQGGAWSLRVSGLSTSAQFIRTRRGDTRAKNGGNNGQLFIINGATSKYSYDWGVTFGDRNLPITATGFDVLG